MAPVVAPRTHSRGAAEVARSATLAEPPTPDAAADKPEAEFVSERRATDDAMPLSMVVGQESIKTALLLAATALASAFVPPVSRVGTRSPSPARPLKMTEPIFQLPQVIFPARSLSSRRTPSFDAKIRA